MKILITCEESGIVTSEFRKLGHEAYSCDILSTSGQNPQWHIKGDVLSLLNGNMEFITQKRNTPIFLKRSCFLVEPTLTPSKECIKKYNEFQPKSKFLVIYEDGTVANKWICKEGETKDEPRQSTTKKVKEDDITKLLLDERSREWVVINSLKSIQRTPIVQFFEPVGDCHSGRGRTGHC